MTQQDGLAAAGGGLVLQPLSAAARRRVSGELICPPDKSVTHRALIFAAMARGQSRILRPLLGADCRSTIGVFRALGVTAQVHPGMPDKILVDSPGWDGWRAPLTPLDYGNSGTTARLVTGVFAATPGLFVTAWGDASLSLRPMARVVEPLRQVGAQISGRDGGRFLPLAVDGCPLHAFHHTVDKPTAQVKSALLLAGLNVDGETTVTLPAGSRNHTETMLQALGAEVLVTFDARTHSETLTVRGPFRPAPRDYEIPGDPSSAAFFIVLGCLLDGGSIRVRGVLANATRTGFLRVLERMGARLTQTTPIFSGAGALEPTMDLTAFGGHPLQAVDVEPELAPTLIDEIPILAALAMSAHGTSRFRGLAELRVKESDRLARTAALVEAAGGQARVEGDDLLIDGPVAVKAFRFDPWGDHRLAMAAAVLAKLADGPCTIVDPTCVDVSFPGFFAILASFDKQT